MQDVVILGTGAFGLEAMEAANRAGAKSIALITRPRDRCCQSCLMSMHHSASRSPDHIGCAIHEALLI